MNNSVLGIEQTSTHKIYKIGMLKIKIRDFKNELKNYKNQLQYIVRSYNKTLFDLCQEINYKKNIKEDFNVKNILSEIKSVPEYVTKDQTHNFLNILLGCEAWTYNEKYNNDKILISWEIRPNLMNTKILQKAINENKKCIFIGDSFLRSINNFADKNALAKFQKGISFTIDDLTSYFDATKASRLELMLNDKNLILSEEQISRARKCINFIVKNHLTKYNCQPIFEPEIGRKGVKKVLVVDQSYNDMSILKGLANDDTFTNMLETAIKENPDADIIVKTHPDTMAGANGGYYTGLEQHGNIYPQTDPINPISLINYVDKVYVCSTQFGFEALMCGKEVHTFGMPFYAGWGLTIDAQKCDRRTNTRTLEEIFYIAYIIYSLYVSPITQKRCEIEEAMDYLLKLREEYFKSKNLLK